MNYDEFVDVLSGEIYKTDYYDNVLEYQIKKLKNEDRFFDSDAYLNGWVEAVEKYFDELEL